MQIALVLWDGNVGGAEKVTAELAGGLRSIGVDASVVFVRDPGALAADLDRLDVPYVSLGAKRVEEVLWRPRRFARLVERHGRDGALLPAVGHQAPALRIGGYRAPLIGMEHGFLLMIDSMRAPWRIARRLERRLSAPFVDTQVAVSDFMLGKVVQKRQALRAVRIYNGVSVRPQPRPSSAPLSGPIVFGHAARLIDGKGSDTLIAAFARSEAGRSARLLIAGDGPERPRLERLVDSLKLGSRIQFVGVAGDIWEFWSRCDVAVVPSDAFIESFGMVAVEAMSLGKPVIATRNGGLPEVVGPAGILVEPGDVAGMAFAMDRYAADDELRHVHGSRGRARCERTFAIHRCATDFAELFAHIGQGELSPLPASDGLLEEVHA